MHSTSDPLIELGYAKGRVILIIDSRFTQFDARRMAGLLADSRGINIRPKGTSHRLSPNVGSRYESWRTCMTKAQWLPPQEFSQIPVHYDLKDDGSIFAYWPEPDMIKPPRRRNGKRHKKCDADTARAILLDIMGNNQAAYDTLIAMHEEVTECLEVLCGQEI